MPTRVSAFAGGAGRQPKTEPFFSTSSRGLVFAALALAWILAAAAPAGADVLPPGGRRPRPQEEQFLSTTIKLQIDPGSTVATLNIPKADVEKLVGRRGRGALLPFDGRTIAAGLALSAAAVSVVLVLRRQSAKRRSVKIAAASLVAVVTTLGALQLAWGNAPAPRPTPRQPPAEQSPADPTLEVVAVSKGQGVTLLIPPNMLKDLQRLVGEVQEAQDKADDADKVAPAKNAPANNAPSNNAPSKTK